MSRGIVFGYELALRVNRKREQLEDEYDNQIVVEIGKSAIFKKGNLGFRVHSDELEREYHDIRVMMGRLGVRGTMRDVEPLHITWGDAPRRVPWNIQMEAVEIMEEVRQASKDIEADSRFVTETGLYIPPKVLLDPLEFYPGKY